MSRDEKRNWIKVRKPKGEYTYEIELIKLNDKLNRFYKHLLA